MVVYHGIRVVGFECKHSPHSTSHLKLKNSTCWAPLIEAELGPTCEWEPRIMIKGINSSIPKNLSFYDWRVYQRLFEKGNGYLIGIAGFFFPSLIQV